MLDEGKACCTTARRHIWRITVRLIGPAPGETKTDAARVQSTLQLAEPVIAEIFTACCSDWTRQQQPILAGPAQPSSARFPGLTTDIARMNLCVAALEHQYDQIFNNKARHEWPSGACC